MVGKAWKPVEILRLQRVELPLLSFLKCKEHGGEELRSRNFSGQHPGLGETLLLLLLAVWSEVWSGSGGVSRMIGQNGE